MARSATSDSGPTERWATGTRGAGSATEPLSLPATGPCPSAPGAPSPAGSSTLLQSWHLLDRSGTDLRLVELVGLPGLPADRLGRASGSCLCSVRSFGNGMDAVTNRTYIFNGYCVGYRIAGSEGAGRLGASANVD